MRTGSTKKHTTMKVVRFWRDDIVKLAKPQRLRRYEHQFKTKTGIRIEKDYGMEDTE